MRGEGEDLALVRRHHKGTDIVVEEHKQQVCIKFHCRPSCSLAVLEVIIVVAQLGRSGIRAINGGVKAVYESSAPAKARPAPC